MGVFKGVGGNDTIDSGDRPDVEVSFEPMEIDSASDEEKSDHQRAVEGLFEEEDVDEIFVTPESDFSRKVEEKEEEEEKTEDEKPSGDEEKKEEEPEKKEGEEVKEEEEPGDKPEEKKPASAPDAVQKRINKITREKYEERRRAEKAEERLKALEQRMAEVDHATKKAELFNSRPKPDDFEEETSYQEELARWAAKVELHEGNKPKEEKKEEAVEETPQQQFDTARTRIVDVGRETYPDFDEVVLGDHLVISPDMVMAANDSEHAIDIVYYLGQNPEESKRIASLKSPTAIIREIGRIESKFMGNEDVEEVYVQTPEKDNEFAEKSKKPKKQKTPPEPIKPLGGGGRVPTKLENAGMQDYSNARGFTVRGGVYVKK